MLELLPCTLKSNNKYNKMDILKIAIWNANGLLQRLQELKVFINTNKVNVLLISEIHFTVKSFIKIPFYNVYSTKHPSGRGYGVQR